MKRILAALLLVATSASAIMAPPSAREDAKRFGFNHFNPTQRANPAEGSRRAFQSFNGRKGRWKLRFSPRTGLPTSLMGGKDVPRPGTPDAAARSFLSSHADLFGIDPSVLTLERQVKGNGHQHLLYRQSYHGIPVDSVAVKVHLAMDGSVLGVTSTFEPNLTLPTTPSVPVSAAMSVAKADAGGGEVRGAPTLAIIPLETDGKSHLAWKLRVDGRSGAWRYYIDALTGQVLFRYSVHEFLTGGTCASPGGTNGVISGSVFDIDPQLSNQIPVIRPFNDQYVYVGSPPTQALTGYNVSSSSGYYCAVASGKIAMSLQGPYVSVGQFRGPNAHYDNGGGLWLTTPTPIHPVHPYPNNANIVNTITLSNLNPPPVEFLPVFSDLTVGSFGGGSGPGSEGAGDIIDDDRLIISDGNGNPVASYVGSLGSFNGAAVHGQAMSINLRSNESGQENGYDINVSSYMYFPNPADAGPGLSSHTWTSSDTWIASQFAGLHGEISLFYHLNLMHDYFMNGVNSAGVAPITQPVVAMAYVGPGLVNAFYDPDYDDLSFGDGGNNLNPIDGFMDDATVPHHEYVHYMVQKIWNIQNFGQAGTLSEANADYFSASSLNDPAIGSYVLSTLGDGYAPLRQIDDTVPEAAPFNVPYKLTSPTGPGWTGEIHDDSPYLSQALWDIRRQKIADLGYSQGVACADSLEFQALLYFPESFADLYEAMLQIDANGAVAGPCNGANQLNSLITASFDAHGILPAGGDQYEPNDGFETATDISTIPVVTATIYPAADEDFYSFGAGPGLVQIQLALPPDSNPNFFEAYQVMLYNASRQLVASASPVYNGPGTLDGVCASGTGLDCPTTTSRLNLSYNNPTGQLLYVQIVGGTSNLGSNSSVNSLTPYTLTVSRPNADAFAGAVVSAQYDHDVIGFTVNTSTFVSIQDFDFDHAQLRDQSDTPLGPTLTHIPAQAGDYLLFLSSQNVNGQISGQVQISTGFVARFPSVGTVYLEVFAADRLGNVSSMGQSNPLNLSESQSSLTAYNNLFNPLLGQKATIKYAVSGTGRLTLKIHTITGRPVLTLFDGQVSPGMGSVDWNGQNESGSTVASGIYVVRAAGPGLNATQKIAVIK